jgi:hypothetical protein
MLAGKPNSSAVGLLSCRRSEPLHPFSRLPVGAAKLCPKGATAARPHGVKPRLRKNYDVQGLVPRAGCANCLM